MERLHAILIKDFITKDPIVAELGDTVADAYEKMHTHQIRHLPVVDREGNLMGIFSQTDLNRAYTPHEMETGWYYDKEGMALLNLEHFMTKDPAALTPENTLKEAAEMMGNQRFGCLPIVVAGTRKLVGIISYVDILREIAKLF